MGILEGQFTERDLSFDTNTQTKTRTRTYKPTSFDNFIHSPVYGIEKGLLALPNTVDRMINGDEGADKRLKNVDNQIKPTAQGTSGQFMSGMGGILAPAMLAAPLGIVGMGASTYASSYSIEHSRLTQDLKVDDDTADKAAFTYGATNAALAFVPASNIFKPVVKDYIVAVGGTTLAGQVSAYVEGDILESGGYEKVGKQYKDAAIDPLHAGLNGVVASAFFAYGRVRNNPNISQQQVNESGTKLDNLIDAEIAEVDRQSTPTQPKTADDLMQHEKNLNTAIDQVMKGEKVNISDATGGEFKTMQDLRSYLQSNKSSYSKFSSNKQNNTTIDTIKNSSNLNLKSKISNNHNARIMDSYKAAQEAGFSPSQARALVGELGRENDYNINLMFGSHNDPARGYNLGIFSWQDSTKGKGRRTNLVNFLTQKGLMNADGTIKRTNEALVAQFEFLRSEIESNPKWKSSFLDRKDISNDDARAALGGAGSVIGWARKQTTIRKKDGSREPFDWQSHEARANKYSSVIDGVNHQVSKTHTLRSNIDEEDTSVSITDLDIDELFTHNIETDMFLNLKVDDSSSIDINLLQKPDIAKEVDPEVEALLHKMDEDLERLVGSIKNEAQIPHIVKPVEVNENLQTLFKPLENDTVWTEKTIFEKNKPYKQESRIWNDKDGNIVQELKYKDSYVRRIKNSDGITQSIHVGKKDQSDMINHKDDRDLEVSLERAFNDKTYGYLSHIPKGLETIAKLEENPNLVITSKQTGEDLTGAQWQQRLNREQDNIQTIAKVMKTLAKCALKKAT